MSEYKTPVPISLEWVYKEVRGLRDQSRRNLFFTGYVLGAAVVFLGISFLTPFISPSGHLINAFVLITLGGTFLLYCVLRARGHISSLRSVMVNSLSFGLGATIGWLVTALF